MDQDDEATTAPAGPRRAGRAARLGGSQSPMRVRGMIRSEIRQGVLTDGDQLVERQMVESYGSSRTAIREAMGQLAEDGLITRQTRYGTIVAGRITSVSLITGSWWTEGEQHSFEPIDIESGELPATEMLRTLLRSTEDTVHMTDWLLRRGGEPFSLFTNFWIGDPRPRSLGDGGQRDDFAALFESHHGVALGKAVVNVEAVSSDARMAKLLDTKPGRPLLFRERLLYDVDGVPREYSHAYWSGVKASLSLTFEM
jgi:GntR family transcriptional regulator